MGPELMEGYIFVECLEDEMKYLAKKIQELKYQHSCIYTPHTCRGPVKMEPQYKCRHGIVYKAQSINVDMVLFMRLRV